MLKLNYLRRHFYFIACVSVALCAMQLFASETLDSKSDELIPAVEGKKANAADGDSDTKIKIELSKLGNDFISFIRTKRWRDAENKVQEIRKLSGDSVEYNYFKAAYLYSTGDFQKPIEFLNRAIELNPNHDPSYYLLGMIFGKFRNWVKSSYYLEIAAAKGTYNPFYQYNLAVTYFMKKDYASAKLSAEKTIELKDNYHAAKILLIRSLMKLGNMEDALALCERYENEKLNSEIFLELYASVLFDSKKKYSKVITLLSKMKNLKSESRRNLGYSLFVESRFVEALNIYRQIFQSGFELEKDFPVYLQVLIRLEKDSDAENFVLNWIKKFPQEKEKILEFYQNLLDERDVFGSMYKPIPWR